MFSYFYIINICVIIVFICLFFITRKTNKRWSKINDYLGKVTTTVDSIRYGNLSTKIEKIEHPTYQNVTDSINRMVETLNDREKMIIEYQAELMRQNKLLESVIKSLTENIEGPSYYLIHLEGHTDDENEGYSVYIKTDKHYDEDLDAYDVVQEAVKQNILDVDDMQYCDDVKEIGENEYYNATKKERVNEDVSTNFKLQNIIDVGSTLTTLDDNVLMKNATSVMGTKDEVIKELNEEPVLSTPELEKAVNESKGDKVVIYFIDTKKQSDIEDGNTIVVGLDNQNVVVDKKVLQLD